MLAISWEIHIFTSYEPFSENQCHSFPGHPVYVKYPDKLKVLIRKVTHMTQLDDLSVSLMMEVLYNDERGLVNVKLFSIKAKHPSRYVIHN